MNVDYYSKISNELKEDFPKLSDFERLSLAIQIERNQLLENGLNISRVNTHPASLEAIAIALGFSSNRHQPTITQVLESRE
jgi:hypothetical protein